MGLMDLLTQQQNKCGTGYIWNGKVCVSEDTLKVPVSHSPIGHTAISSSKVDEFIKDLQNLAPDATTSHITTSKTTYPNNSIAIGGKLITNPFEYQGKKVVQVDYNGHTLKFGPQLLDTWVPADGPIKNFKIGVLDGATMQAPSMGQHNGWHNRWDANRVINGGTSKGFMNIGTSGVLPTDFKYTFLSGGYGVNNIFYRITFIEGDDIVRNGDMTKPWEATYSGHTTKTTWDFRSKFPFSYEFLYEYRTHEDGPWISINPNQQYQIAKTYNNIPWGFIATSGLDPAIMMFKFAGGTSAGSLFAIDKVEMYKE